MSWTRTQLTDHLLDRLRQVQRHLGLEEESVDAATQLGDVLDSMAMVEFLGLLAEDCGVKPAALEECVGRRFGSLADLAQAMAHAAILPVESRPTEEYAEAERIVLPEGWLEGTAIRLPTAIQPTSEVDAILQRPVGWFKSHAGIRSRRLWLEDDPLEAAVDAARACLEEAEFPLRGVGALLVTSEAPPLLAGLGAALHHRLGLPPGTVTLEIGGACTGFLAALWTAQRLLLTVHSVLVLAVEAPSYHVRVKPGEVGEAAALFGDGAAACLLTDRSLVSRSMPLRQVILGTDGSAGSLLRVERTGDDVEVHMQGSALAGRALTAMGHAVHVLLRQQGLGREELQAIVLHGGNGRMPGLLARQLGLPPERVWSTTPETGNLGSASLPAAWASRPPVAGPVIWVSVGAGLTWAAALFG